MLIFTGSDSYPERRGVRKGNTVYVYGSGLVEDSLRSAFCQHGNIIDLSMDHPRKYATIKYAISELLWFSYLLAHTLTLLSSWSCVSPSSCAFITFEKMESADQAVAEVNIMLSKKTVTSIKMFFYRFWSSSFCLTVERNHSGRCSHQSEHC